MAADLAQYVTPELVEGGRVSVAVLMAIFVGTADGYPGAFGLELVAELFGPSLKVFEDGLGCGVQFAKV
jgi:hypothetical protein